MAVLVRDGTHVRTPPMTSTLPHAPQLPSGNFISPGGSPGINHVPSNATITSGTKQPAVFHCATSARRLPPSLDVAVLPQHVPSPHEKPPHSTVCAHGPL